MSIRPKRSREVPLEAGEGEILYQGVTAKKAEEPRLLGSMIAMITLYR